MVYIEVLLSVLKKFRGFLRLERWFKILLSLSNGQNEADCHGSVTNPVRGGDTFLEFALKTSLISPADSMKRTVTILSRNRFTDDHAAASLSFTLLHDNGQFLRKTWHSSEKIPSTLQRAFLPLLGGTGEKILCSETRPLSNGQIEVFCLTLVTKKEQKKKRLSA